MVTPPPILTCVLQGLWFIFLHRFINIMLQWFILIKLNLHFVIQLTLVIVTSCTFLSNLKVFILHSKLPLYRHHLTQVVLVCFFRFCPIYPACSWSLTWYGEATESDSQHQEGNGHALTFGEAHDQQQSGLHSKTCQGGTAREREGLSSATLSWDHEHLQKNFGIL